MTSLLTPGVSSHTMHGCGPKTSVLTLQQQGPCQSHASSTLRAWALLAQVTTFKVRTIRSQGGSTDQASAALTWTTAEEGCLDKAAGGQEQLLARAMSIAGLPQIHLL